MVMSDTESDPDTIETEESESLTIERPDEYLPTEWVPRDAIEPNDWNPNEMEQEDRRMLRRSIKNHGWTRPIVVHAEDEYIIDGEQRWTVADHPDIADQDDLTPPDVPAGYVPVFGISVSEEDAKVSTLQHNRARGFVDYNSLYDYLDEFHQQDMLDDLRWELEMEEDDMLRIVEDQTVAEAVGEGHDVGHPWEPRDIREFDSEDLSSGASRTSAMAESDSDESVSRVSAVLTEDEYEKVTGVFGEDDTAETLIQYVAYIDDHDLIEAFQDTVGIEPDPEDYPHPDAAGDDEEEPESETVAEKLAE